MHEKLPSTTSLEESSFLISTSSKSSSGTEHQGSTFNCSASACKSGSIAKPSSSTASFLQKFKQQHKLCSRHYHTNFIMVLVPLSKSSIYTKGRNYVICGVVKPWIMRFGYAKIFKYFLSKLSCG